MQLSLILYSCIVGGYNYNGKTLIPVLPLLFSDFN